MTSAKNSAAAVGKPALVVERQDKDEAPQDRVPYDAEAHSYRRQSVFVDGLTLNYVSAAAGRPVVLIHGNPGSHQDYTLAVIERLSQSYYVVAFDRPGHGYSERPDSVETTVEVQAQIILNALRKLRIEKPVLVGHSWGAPLCLPPRSLMEPTFSDIRLPVVIVTGSADLLLEPKNHAYRLHKAINDSKLIVLPRTGHQLPQTRPDAVIEAIADAWGATMGRSDVKLS